jgi:N-acetyl-gamma-glutamyl-phosphate reductase
VPLPLSVMPMAGSPEVLRLALVDSYTGSKIVTVHDEPQDELLLRRSMQPSDRLDLWVFGAADGSQARLVARLDNLGKGASGAAVQSLNLMAGLEETLGLSL